MSPAPGHIAHPQAHVASPSLSRPRPSIARFRGPASWWICASVALLTACGSGDGSQGGALADAGTTTGTQAVATEGGAGANEAPALADQSKGAAASAAAIAARAGGTDATTLGLGSVSAVQVDFRFRHRPVKFVSMTAHHDNCHTNWKIVLRGDGRVRVSKNINGGTAHEAWLKLRNVADLAVTRADIQNGTVVLLDAAGSSTYHLDLKAANCQIPLIPDLTPTLSHTLNSRAAAMRVVTGSDRQSRVILRTQTGWVEEDGTPTVLGADVIDVVTSDPVLESDYINNGRLFALRSDGTVQVYRTGLDGLAQTVAGVPALVQITGDDVSVFARTAGGEIYWLNADEAGSSLNSNTSLPTHPDAPPQLIAGPATGACAIGNLHVMACGTREAHRIITQVFGTSTQTGAFLKSVNPATQATGIMNISRLLTLAPISMMGSPFASARAVGSGILLTDGRVLNSAGQVIALP